MNRELRENIPLSDSIIVAIAEDDLDAIKNVSFTPEVCKLIHKVIKGFDPVKAARDLGIGAPSAYQIELFFRHPFIADIVHEAIANHLRGAVKAKTIRYLADTMANSKKSDTTRLKASRQLITLMSEADAVRAAKEEKGKALVKPPSEMTHKELREAIQAFEATIINQIDSAKVIDGESVPKYTYEELFS